MVPMLDLKAEYAFLKADIDAAIARCLDHQQWVLGPEVKELEDQVAVYLRVSGCVGCSSGTEALVLALRALAIKHEGKEYFDRGQLIVTTPFTFTATGDAILRSGATPIFVDIDPQTFNIDIGQLKQCLEQTPNVVGIVAVHLYGRPCEMDQVMGLAKSRNLFVVEDAAQAFGGDWKKKKLGTIGDAGCFSFFPSKNLGGFGDGGMVCSEDAQLRDLVRELTKHGGKDKYNVDHIGYNARLDTLQASVVLAKLKFLDEFNTRRRAIALRYQEGLHRKSGMVLPQIVEGHVFHQYTLRVPEREKLQAYLQQKAIQTALYYPYSLHTMKVFQSVRIFGQLTNTEAVCRQVLSLPIGPLQTSDTTDLIIQALNSWH